MEMAKVTPDTITPEMVKAARALLGWNAAEAAGAMDGVGVTTLRKFESGQDVSAESRKAILDALACHGITLQNGGRPGVRLNAKG